MSKPSLFETETCSRCGGTGHHSFTPTWGTTCFGCGRIPHAPGRGWNHTVRGARALDYFVALMSKPAAEVQVGELVRPPRRQGLGEVVEIGTYTYQHKSGDGPWEESTIPRITVRYKGGSTYTFTSQPSALVRVGQTPEAKRQALAHALAYQDLLTKRGTERKSKAAQAALAKLPIKSRK